jgi:serine/threonine protein kinase
MHDPLNALNLATESSSWLPMGYPESLVAVCARCIQTDPGARYTNVDELSSVLREVFSSSEVGSHDVATDNTSNSSAGLLPIDNLDAAVANELVDNPFEQVALVDRREMWEEKIEQSDNTLGLDQSSTQPSTIAKKPEAKLPIEFGRYRLLHQLGEGGMGKVYLAHDTELDRKVALKLPHFSGADCNDLADRFRREARLAATLDHSNICRIYDIGEYQNQLYLTMAYVEGQALNDILKFKGTIEPRAAVTLLRRIAQVVHFAHGHGVIHRDLKPANIMIKKDRDFVIMDFGLARRVDQEEPQLTATGAVLGTPAYMAPEQLRGEKGASGPQSDVYSLGIILFELLTGRRPFQGTLPQIYAQILTSESVSPSLVRNNVDSALDEICLKATNKEVTQRYQSAQELASALDKYLGSLNCVGSALEAGPKQQDTLNLPLQQIAAKPPRRRRPNAVITALGGAAFFALLLGVIVILVRNKDGTTTEYPLAEGAVSVEVQKDDRTLVVVDVSDAPEPAAKEPGMRSADDSPAGAELQKRTSNFSGLSSEAKSADQSPYVEVKRFVVEGLRDKGNFVSIDQLAPLRSSDLVRFSIELAEPAFVQLLWLDSTGQVSTVDTGDHGEGRVRTIEYPVERDRGLVLEPHGALELAVLIVSRDVIASSSINGIRWDEKLTFEVDSFALPTEAGTNTKYGFFEPRGLTGKSKQVDSPMLRLMESLRRTNGEAVHVVQVPFVYPERRP